MKFSDLSLTKEVVLATERANYAKPYPIQVQAIPALIKGKV
jgi:ATP-dependent RNA helicase RhlE